MVINKKFRREGKEEIENCKRVGELCKCLKIV